MDERHEGDEKGIKARGNIIQARGWRDVHLCPGRRVPRDFSVKDEFTFSDEHLEGAETLFLHKIVCVGSSGSLQVADRLGVIEDCHLALQLLAAHLDKRPCAVRSRLKSIEQYIEM